ncbi:MAG: hypothetical protein RL563_123 [Pseudomonadota bacterium]
MNLSAFLKLTGYLGLLILMLSGCVGGKTQSSPEPDAPITHNQVTIHASAPMSGTSREHARQSAIDNATQQAAIELKGSAQSVLMSDIKIVDEWQEDGQYHVQALARLSKNNKTGCNSAYRKKIVATAFPLMNLDQIAGTETQDLFKGIPREIGNQLMETGNFITRNQTDIVLYARPDLAPEVPLEGIGLSGSSLLRIARLNDAQFVLSGVIRDFKVESTEYTRGAGILAQFKWALRDIAARRSVGIDVYIHDGYTGALLFQQRYTDSILGDIYLPSGYTVGSERFEANPAGHAISEIIRMASQDIGQFLTCYPLTARVTQVNNNQVTIAAGAQDKIRVGERLLVYAAGFTHTVGLGFNETLGLLTINTVGPTLATGTLDDNHGVVRPGDWVRIANQ